MDKEQGASGREDVPALLPLVLILFRPYPSLFRSFSFLFLISNSSFL